MKKGAAIYIALMLCVAVAATPSLAAPRLQLPVLRGEHQFGVVYEPGQVRLTGSEVVEWPTRHGTFTLVLDTVQPVTIAQGQEPTFGRIYFQGELAYTRPQWGIDWTVGMRGRWQPEAGPVYGGFMLAAWGW